MAKGHEERGRAEQQGTPTSVALATRGIKTSTDFTAVAAALFVDIGERTVEPDQGRAMNGALGRIVQMIELEVRVGLNPKARQAINLIAV